MMSDFTDKPETYEQALDFLTEENWHTERRLIEERVAELGATDRKALIVMFDRVGVVWTGSGPSITVEATPGRWAPVSNPRIEAPHNEGYAGFFTTFDFDADGMLTTVGVWE